MVPDWILGLALNVFGCVAVNGGTNVMKRGVDEGSDGTGGFVWYVGAAFFAGGNVCNFISFSLAPQSLLASVSAIQFVTNVFFARWFLNEEITRRIILGTCIIMAGIVICVQCSSHENVHFGPHALWGLYANPVYLAYLSIQAAVCVGLQLMFRRAPPDASYRPACFSVVSAAAGTQSIVQAKCISEIIFHSDEEDSLQKYPSLIAFLVGILTVLVMSQAFWLRRMQRALALFRGSVIIPTLQVFWTSLSILSGGLFFKEFRKMSPLQAIAFALGMMILFIGVRVLVPPKENETLIPFAAARERYRATLFFGPGLIDNLEFNKELGRATVTASRRQSEDYTMEVELTAPRRKDSQVQHDEA